MELFKNGKSKKIYLESFNGRLSLPFSVFLGKMVWDHWNQVKDASFTLRPFPFILSTLIFAFSYFIQIWAWYLITLKLEDCSFSIRNLENLVLFATGQIPARENLASSQSFLFLRIERKIEEGYFRRPLLLKPLPSSWQPALSFWLPLSFIER